MAKKDEYTQEKLNKLGNGLPQFQLEQGFSNYEQFAFEHNLPRAHYGRYEQGQDLRFSSFLKVRKALSISLEEFFKEGFDSKIPAYSQAFIFKKSIKNTLKMC